MLPPTAPSTTVVFLKKLHDFLGGHLSDTSLTVDSLTQQMGMSRTDLHRKLSQTVGMSTTEYLCYLRLRRAAELLLQQPDWPVGQIAVEVGFDSQSYFSRRFRQWYGMSATAYRKAASEQALLAKLEAVG